jgi:hypothetical protein
MIISRRKAVSFIEQKNPEAASYVKRFALKPNAQIFWDSNCVDTHVVLYTYDDAELHITPNDPVWLHPDWVGCVDTEMPVYA